MTGPKVRPTWQTALMIIVAVLLMVTGAAVAYASLVLPS